MLTHRVFLAAASAALCALSALRLTPTAGAQVLRGVVRDSASRQPIPGVVLVLLDSSGRLLGRNITNEGGQYAVTLNDAMRRIQLLRIGFRPRDVAIPRRNAGAATLDVVMTAIPTLLTPVTVIDQPNCPRRDDRPAAFALWEQAKTALLATVVAREAQPAKVIRLHYVRRLTDDDKILAQTVRIDSASTDRPFVASRSAAAFVENGFAYDSARSRWYNGPDADVMLDDAFARGYCFEIAAADPARPREIGLGFTSASYRRGRIDIRGIVWIDSVSRSLTDITFTYVGLEARADRFHPGGRVSFRRMDNGTVIIDRWFMRFPAPKPLPLGASPYALVSQTLEPHETGGEVAHAVWPDGHEWQASLGMVHGRVTGAGGPGTVVQLAETDYRATVDSVGIFEISNLLPGPYSVGAQDVRLAELEILLKTLVRFTAERDSVANVVVEVPSAAEYVAGKCEADARAQSSVVLVARVFMPDGTPARGAHVEVRAAGGGSLSRIVEGEADEAGLFHLCHAPRGSVLQIRAEHDGASPTLVLREMTTNIVAAKILLKRAR